MTLFYDKFNCKNCGLLIHFQPTRENKTTKPIPLNEDNSIHICLFNSHVFYHNSLKK